MSASKPTYCWDTSVFLAWVGGEEGAPLGNIELVVSELDRGTANLLVSVTTITEILDARHTPEEMAQFRSFLLRPNVTVADVTQRIAEKAAAFRSRGCGARPPRAIKTPDATIMATACIYRATVLHTTEAKKLPNLSGTPVVDGLVITTPRPWSGLQSIFGEPPPPPPPPPPTGDVEF